MLFVCETIYCLTFCKRNTISLDAMVQRIVRAAAHKLANDGLARDCNQNNVFLAQEAYTKLNFAGNINRNAHVRKHLLQQTCQVQGSSRSVFEYGGRFHVGNKVDNGTLPRLCTRHEKFGRFCMRVGRICALSTSLWQGAKQRVGCKHIPLP